MSYGALLALSVGLVSESLATYEECLKNGGKEIVVDICIPKRYDTNMLPKSPMIIYMILEVNGLKKVDILSNTFSIYLSTK